MSFDNAEENAAFAEKFSFPYPLLCDTTRALGLAYHACESQEDRHARRITYVIGPDGRIRMAIDDVKPGEHPAELLAGLT